MPKYENLTQEQKELYDKLKTAIEKQEDIFSILKDVSKEDLREILTTANITKEFSDDRKYTLTPLGYAINYRGYKYMEAILDVAQKNSVLEELLNSTEENDRENLKKILEAFKNQEQNEEQKNKINGWLEMIPVYKSNISKIENSSQKDSAKPASQSIIIGSVCGVIAALAVGVGCFAAGVTLPMLALIGIAVAAAVVTGLVAGGIIYEVYKPCNELKDAIAQATSSPVRS